MPEWKGNGRFVCEIQVSGHVQVPWQIHKHKNPQLNIPKDYPKVIDSLLL